MRFRIWASAIAIIVLPVEGALLAMNWSHPPCPPGEPIRMPMPFEHFGGQSWSVALPELERLADNMTETPNGSTVAICENRRLLGPAHATLRDITKSGRGQYLHWGRHLVFSTSDNSDPNANGRSYLAIKTAHTTVRRPPVRPQQTISRLLVDNNKRTLYTFDGDSDGKSTCSRTCAETWLPYADRVETHNPPSQATSSWSVIARDDGTKMWAHQGRPLYYFVGDKIPGDVNGDGLDGRWHAARSH